MLHREGTFAIIFVARFLPISGQGGEQELLKMVWKKKYTFSIQWSNTEKNIEKVFVELALPSQTMISALMTFMLGSRIDDYWICSWVTFVHIPKGRTTLKETR